ncbi:hypothetical protein SEA_BIANCATRI92_78 [Mycobacterium phage BiancaTri92]|nr:hypothetical protein SEA_BIANCATRI92_78 [Mycobacterium phage BiancaTri92]
MDNCDHNWQLTETGYVRTWHTELDEESQTIRTYFGGSEDWSESGAGDEHLQCSTCLLTKPLPEGWEIDYQ